MNSNTNAAVSFDKNASFATGASPGELSDSDLLVATRPLTGRSNQLLASLLAHLAEVEVRGIHRLRAARAYTYCVYELRLSEDEAYRRVAAARLVRRFPVVLDAVAAGELHLTGLLMLGPLLTNENLVEVLARAKHRTKKRSRAWSASSIRCRTFPLASNRSAPRRREPDPRRSNRPRQREPNSRRSPHPRQRGTNPRRRDSHHSGLAFSSPRARST